MPFKTDVLDRLSALQRAVDALSPLYDIPAHNPDGPCWCTPDTLLFRTPVKRRLVEIVVHTDTGQERELVETILSTIRDADLLEDDTDGDDQTSDHSNH